VILSVRLGRTMLRLVAFGPRFVSLENQSAVGACGSAETLAGKARNALAPRGGPLGVVR
jgi:hypothetical protein